MKIHGILVQQESQHEFKIVGTNDYIVLGYKPTISVQPPKRNRVIVDTTRPINYHK